MRPFDKHFTRLVKKYGVPFVFIQKEQGRFESGKWTEGGTSETPLRGAIVPLAERRVTASGGVYTATDRQLIVSAPLGGALDDARVKHGGKVYSVSEETAHGEYGDVYVYLLKYASGFLQGGAG